MNIRKKMLYGFGVFLLMQILFWFAAESPRGRLNITQFVAVFFLGILFLRFLKVQRFNCITPTVMRESMILPVSAVLFSMLIWGTMLTTYFLGDDYLLVYMGRTPVLELMASVFRYGDGGIFYRPLTFTSFAWDHAIWGEWPVGYHITSFILHFASIAGLFALLGRLGVQRQAAATTAAIFAAMPIQVESVAWISGRFDVLSTALILWSVFFYLRARSKSSLAAYAMALVIFVLAMCSKETGFILPLLLTAIELIVLRIRLNWRIAGFIVIGGLAFVYRMFALGGIGGYRTHGVSSAVDFSFKTLEGLLIRAPSQMLFGFNWLQPNDILTTALASLMAVLLMVLVISARLEKQQRTLINFALAWILTAMIPAHFLLLIGPGLSNSRVLHLASAGTAIVLGQLLITLNGRRFRNAMFVALIAVLNLGVLHNIAAWRWASDLAKRTHQSIVQIEPSPAARTQFVISNIPDSVRGVFFFRTGLSESLKMAYGRDDISAVRDIENAARQQPQVRLFWLGEPSALLQRQ